MFIFLTYFCICQQYCIWSTLVFYTSPLPTWSKFWYCKRCPSWQLWWRRPIPTRWGIGDHCEHGDGFVIIMNSSATWIIMGSGNGLVPAWHQSITWTDDDSLCTGHFETNFSEIWINPQKFSSKKMHLKTLSEKWRSFFRPQCDESGKAMGQNQTDVTLYLVPWGNRIKAWISNYIHIKQRDVITYPCPNLSWTLIEKADPGVTPLLHLPMVYYWNENYWVFHLQFLCVENPPDQASSAH